MRARTRLIMMLVAAGFLAACGGRGGENSPPRPAQTFTATVTSVEIVRSADGLDMPVSGLPASGATLSVR